MASDDRPTEREIRIARVLSVEERMIWQFERIA